MIKLIADSSADVTAIKGVPFASVPLTIRTDEREFTDEHDLDIGEMLDYMQAYQGRSGTACPSPERWMNAYAGADEILVVSLTSGLSGTYTSAMSAAEMHLSMHPEKRIHVFDTLSAGPEMRLLLERLAELIRQGRRFDELVREGTEYLKRTRLMCCLQSLHNFAQNGRVSKVAAKAVGLLGIRILAGASEEGTLELIEKCRGEKKALAVLLEKMHDAGYRGGKLRLAHAQGEQTAQALSDLVLARFPNADVKIYPCRGLCAYYAERGGVLAGFETI